MRAAIYFFAFFIQIIALVVALYCLYALAFEPELIGRTFAQIINGFKDTYR